MAGSLKITVAAGQSVSISTPTIATLNNKATCSIGFRLEVASMDAGATGSMASIGGTNPMKVAGVAGAVAAVSLVFRKATGTAVSYTASPIDLNSGHYYTLSYNATGTTVLRRDGGTLSTALNQGNTIASDTAVAIGFTGDATHACTYYISDFALWTNYSLSLQDCLDLRDGTKTPATLATPATNWWTLQGTAGAVTLNAGGLVDSIGGIGFTTSSGTLALATYDDHTIGISPSVLIGTSDTPGLQAYVDTTGLLAIIPLYINPTSGGGPTIPATVSTDGSTLTPVFRKNGVVIAPTLVTLDGVTGAILYELPSALSNTDVLTMSAPLGWATTQAGLVGGGLVGGTGAGGTSSDPLTFLNCAGRSDDEQTTTAPATKVAFNTSGYGNTATRTGQVGANWITRTTNNDWKHGTGTAVMGSNGLPVSFSGGFISVGLDAAALANGADGQYVPGTRGKFRLAYGPKGSASAPNFVCSLIVGYPNDWQITETIVSTGTYDGTYWTGIIKDYVLTPKSTVVNRYAYLQLKIDNAAHSGTIEFAPTAFGGVEFGVFGPRYDGDTSAPVVDWDPLAIDRGWIAQLGGAPYGSGPFSVRFMNCEALMTGSGDGQLMDPADLDLRKSSDPVWTNYTDTKLNVVQAAAPDLDAVTGNYYLPTRNIGPDGSYGFTQPLTEPEITGSVVFFKFTTSVPHGFRTGENPTGLHANTIRGLAANWGAWNSGNGGVTLTSAINNTQTVIPVSAVTGLNGSANSLAANQYFQIGTGATAEQVQISSIAGLNLTVTRGKLGTTPQTADSGTALYPVVLINPIGLAALVHVVDDTTLGLAVGHTAIPKADGPAIPLATQTWSAGSCPTIRRIIPYTQGLPYDVCAAATAAANPTGICWVSIPFYTPDDAATAVIELMIPIFQANAGLKLIAERSNEIWNVAFAQWRMASRGLISAPNPEASAGVVLTGNGGSISAGATSFTVTAPTVGTAAIADGTMLIIGSERIMAGSGSTGTSVANALRGAYGTTAASHNDGVAVTVCGYPSLGCYAGSRQNRLNNLAKAAFTAASLDPDRVLYGMTSRRQANVVQDYTRSVLAYCQNYHLPVEYIWVDAYCDYNILATDALYQGWKDRYPAATARAVMMSKYRAFIRYGIGQGAAYLDAAVSISRYNRGVSVDGTTAAFTNPKTARLCHYEGATTYIVPDNIFTDATVTDIGGNHTLGKNQSAAWITDMLYDPAWYYTETAYWRGLQEGAKAYAKLMTAEFPDAPSLEYASSAFHCYFVPAGQNNAQTQHDVYGGYCYGMCNWQGQRPGKGDGSPRPDGSTGSVNILWGNVGTPQNHTLTNTGGTVTFNDSVRFQAALDWAGGATGATMVLQNFDGASVPENGDGDTYPSIYTGEGSAGTVALDAGDAIAGKSLKATITVKGLYLQFNPYGPSGRGFARDYSANPSGWQFNTYNRMSFWLKRPNTAYPLMTDGTVNLSIGTYVKQITNEDTTSDEFGGNHYYHGLNLPNDGQWSLVILNAHPDHYRGEPSGEGPGLVLYPTATNGPNGGVDPPATYNYFDTLTRFYIDATDFPTTGEYLVDEVQFYSQPAEEDDAHVGTVTGTYNPSNNRLTVTWNRPPDDNTIDVEIRYAFSDIHQIGWSAATPAPGGIISPPGWQGYNGMVYDTTALTLTGHSAVYIGIRPANAASGVFTQIAISIYEVGQNPTPISQVFGGGVAPQPQTPTITWSDPADITYPAPLSGTQLNATCGDTTGTFVYSPASGTVLDAGTAQAITVTFTPDDPINWLTTQKTAHINVAKATPTLSWSNPANIDQGTALSATQLNATCTNTTGSFAYDPAAGTVLPAGNGQVLSTTFTPSNTTNWNTATTTVLINVNPAAPEPAIPTIVWSNPADITYPTPLSSTQLNATCPDTTGTFVYSPAAGAVYSAGTNKTLSVTFTPDDTVNWQTAGKIVHINVLKGTPTITWDDPADIVYPTALSSTQLNATCAQALGTFTYTPPSGTVLQPGNAQTLSVAFDANLLSWNDVTATASINVLNTPVQSVPTITWATPDPIEAGTPLSATQLNATADTPGTFTYDPPADTVLPVGNAQILTVSFTPDDTVNWTNASASVDIDVTRATPTIVWDNPGPIRPGVPLNEVQLNATCPDTTGTFTYNPPEGTYLPLGIAQVLSVTFTPDDLGAWTEASATVSIDVLNRKQLKLWIHSMRAIEPQGIRNRR